MSTQVLPREASRAAPLYIVHLCDESIDASRGLCGAELEGIDHERGEENCITCIRLWADRLEEEQSERKRPFRREIKMSRLGNCRSCGATVIWAETKHGKRMPVDEEPTPEGNIILRKHLQEDTPIVVYVGKPDLNSPFEGPPRFTSHFATCPQNKEWRR